MKTFTKILSALTLAALFAAGCVNEDPAYKKGQEPVDPDGAQGYLALGGMSVRVIYDSETEVRPDDTGTRGGAVRTQPATDDFIVTIVDASGKSVLEESYGALKTRFDEAEDNRIALPVGNYTLTVRSEKQDAASDAAWEHPVYGTSYDFPILKDQPTQIGEVVCKLQNIKVTVAISADLAAQLTEETSATVSLGDKSIVFKKGETRAAFFPSLEEANTLVFSLTGKFADTQDPAELTKSIPGVKAGQWRKITLIIPHSDEGGMKLDIEVENFIQDEEIIVDGTDGSWEPEIPDVDPSAPAIAWTDHDLTTPFQLKAAMFDTEGNCTEPFAFGIASPNGIASFTVEVSSDNEAFMTALLGTLQLTEARFDLCTVEAGTELHTALRGFGFPLGDEIAEQTATSFDLAPMMPMLYNRPGFEGRHTFAFTVTDKNSLTSTASLQLVVDKENETPAGPVIVWRDHDLLQRYEVTADLKVDVDVTAPAGIRSFVVTINSDKLEPALIAIGLPEGVNTFDLAHIEDPNLASTLTEEMGFPINENVLDKTELTFSITPFAALLMAPDFQGNHDFRLDITDNDGVTTTATIMMVTK